jgi:hypothetical protein
MKLAASSSTDTLSGEELAHSLDADEVHALNALRDQAVARWQREVRNIPEATHRHADIERPWEELVAECADRFLSLQDLDPDDVWEAGVMDLYRR